MYLRRRLPNPLTVWIAVLTLFAMVIVTEQANAQSFATRFGVRTVVLDGSSDYKPSINDSGNVVYQNGTSGVFSETGGTGLRSVAMVGDPVPGFPGTTFSTFNSFSGSMVGNADIVAFTARPSSFTNNYSLWIQQGTSTPVLLLGQNSAAPGMPNGTKFIGANYSMNDQGQIAILGTIQGLSLGVISAQGIWEQKTIGGPLVFVAGPGASAPGITNGVFKTSFTVPKINNSGDIAFVGDVTTPSGQVSGLYSDAGGSGLTLRAVTGGPIPGLSPSLQLRYIDGNTVTFSDSGKTGIEVQLSGSGITSLNDMAYLVETNNGFKIALQEGTALSGSTGKVVSEIYDTLLDSTAELTATVNLKNVGDALITEIGGGGFRILAQNGGQVPGHPSGIQFTNVFQYSSFEVNSQNALVFGTTFHNISPGADPSDLSYGFFTETSPGIIKSIVQDGDTIEIAPNIFKTINSIERPGLSHRFLNNLNQLTFAASFTDGSSGVFVIAVPEAGTTTLLAIAALAFVAWGIAKRAKRREA
ncbi:hypothetical protein K2Y11_10950 [bacterium]|nr:hypothetical protein [bacterium]